MRSVKDYLRYSIFYLQKGDLIDSSLDALVMNEGVIFDSWLQNKRLDLRLFKGMRVPDACGVGRINVWVLNYLIRGGKIKNETLIHYALLSQISGILLLKGYQVKLPLDHWDGADIVAEKNGKKTAFEFEYHSPSFSSKLLAKQKAYDEVIFIGTTQNIERMRICVRLSISMHNFDYFQKYSIAIFQF